MILFLLALKLAKALFGRHFYLHVVTLFLEPALLKCYCIWKFMASLMFVVIDRVSNQNRVMLLFAVSVDFHTE